MRYLTCTGIFRRSLIASILLMLPATPALALKPPGNSVQSPPPATSAEPSKTTNEKSLPAEVPRASPTRPSSSERVQADSAVSFPVDI